MANGNFQPMSWEEAYRLQNEQAEPQQQDTTQPVNKLAPMTWEEAYQLQAEQFKQPTEVPGQPTEPTTMPVEPVQEEAPVKALQPPAEQQQDLEWRSVLGQSVKNIPSSVGMLIKDTVSALASPIETTKAFVNLVEGTIQKAIPGKQEDEEAFDNYVQYLDNRFGSVENFKRALASDPAGVVSDLASIFMLGGGQIAKAGAITKASKIGRKIEPITAIRKGSREVLKKVIPEELPRRMYAKVAKLSSAIPTKKRNKLVKTAFKYKIMPTVKGVDKITETAEALDQKVINILEKETQAGKTIKVNNLFKGYDKLIKEQKFSGEIKKYTKEMALRKKSIVESAVKEGKVYISPFGTRAFKKKVRSETSKLYHRAKSKEIRQSAAAISRDILNNVDELIKKHQNIGQAKLVPNLEKFIEEAKKAKRPKTEMVFLEKIKGHLEDTVKTYGDLELNPKEVQKIKLNMYNATSKYYDDFKNRPVEIKVKQNIGFSAKNSINDLFPEVKYINKDSHSLKNLRNAITKTADNITFRDLLNINLSLKAVVGGFIAGPVGSGIAVMLDLFNKPLVKAKLAIVADDIRKTGRVIPKNSLLNKILTPETIAGARQVEKVKTAAKEKEKK